MQPKVSICIPCYKQTKYLKLCLDSVLQQSFKDYEVIVSDDTPDDAVKEFISDYKIQNLQYHKNLSPLGSPKNWNAAISKAKGKYIKVLHHDDYFLKEDSLQKFVDAAEKSNVGFVFCDSEVWYTSDNSRQISSPNEVQWKRIQEDPSFLFFRNKIGAPSATLFLNNGSLFDENLKWLVDVDFYISYLKHSSIHHVKEVLVCTAHETPGQITQSVQNDKSIQIREHILVFGKLFTEMKDESKWLSFFGYLFRDYHVGSMEELEKIVSLGDMKDFFRKVFSELNKGVAYKNFVKRIYNSRLNILKAEQF